MGQVNELDTMGKWVRAIRDLGFPIFVSLVLLWTLVLRVPAEMTELRQAIERHTTQLRSLEQAIAVGLRK